MTEGENGDKFFIVSGGTCNVAMAGRHLRELPDVSTDIKLTPNLPQITP